MKLLGEPLMVGKNGSGICSTVMKHLLIHPVGSFQSKTDYAKEFVKKSMHWDFMDVDVVR